MRWMDTSTCLNKAFLLFHMKAELIENDFCKQWMNEDMLCCVFQPYLDINASIIKKCVSDRVRLTAGKPYTMLAEVRYLKSFSSDAREYFASREGSQDLLAIAFLVSTQIEKFMIRLFIELNRPPVPCHIFSNKDEAIEWLNQHKI